MSVVSFLVRASNRACPGQRVKPALKPAAQLPITNVDPATHGAAIP